MGAVQNLGFESVVGVRIGKFLEVKLSESDRTKAEGIVENICQKLLANPVIEEYRYELKVLSEVP
jgi:phosphoribosylformylglycinamidine synthase